MEVLGSLKVSFLGFRLSCARIIGKIGSGGFQYCPWDCGILLKLMRYSSNGTSFPFQSNVEGEVVGLGLVK